MTLIGSELPGKCGISEQGVEERKKEGPAGVICRFLGNKEINGPTWSTGSQSKGWGGKLGSEHAEQ